MSMSMSRAAYVGPGSVGIGANQELKGSSGRGGTPQVTAIAAPH
jgi:hypothetical protein